MSTQCLTVVLLIWVPALSNYSDTMTALNSPIAIPIAGKARDALLESLWGPVIPRHFDASFMDSYFTYYSSQARRFLLDGGRHVAVSTHDDVIHLTQTIEQDRCWIDLHQDLTNTCMRQGLTDTKIPEISLNLCSRLMLMMDIGEPPNGIQGPHTIYWKTGTIREFLNRHFQAEARLQPENPQIGKLFTAMTLARVGGMKLVWTRNLADHLRLVDDDRTVYIFDCVSFLEYQKLIQRTVFPPGFIDETLRTLALLLPQNDTSVQSWVQTQIKDNELDPLLLECGSLPTHKRRYESFQFWHNRLVILKQALDDSRPQTMWQWWHDRRNGVQWYTFWVAILVFIVTIFFGLIQSLEGALQVYLSWKSLQQG
ncbi:hypothetical protein F5Y15DRAFT_386313 [Xylariaceae sp. FL0016]|nr:hypothetical protein F5Y15DRAFT_386313 [Xylariaceae sp. FL0016]